MTGRFPPRSQNHLKILLSIWVLLQGSHLASAAPTDPDKRWNGWNDWKHGDAHHGHKYSSECQVVSTQTSWPYNSSQPTGYPSTTQSQPVWMTGYSTIPTVVPVASEATDSVLSSLYAATYSSDSLGILATTFATSSISAYPSEQTYGTTSLEAFQTQEDLVARSTASRNTTEFSGLAGRSHNPIPTLEETVNWIKEVEADPQKCLFYTNVDSQHVKEAVKKWKLDTMQVAYGKYISAQSPASPLYGVSDKDVINAIENIMSAGYATFCDTRVWVLLPHDDELMDNQGVWENYERPILERRRIPIFKIDAQNIDAAPTQIFPVPPS